MAVEMIRKLICDVGERHDGTHTLSFAVSGATYEVDLCDQHGKAFDKDMDRWIEAGRRAGRGAAKYGVRRNPTPGSANAQVTQDAEYARQWAKLTGSFNVKDTGRVSPTVLKAWREAGAPTGTAA